MLRILCFLVLAVFYGAKTQEECVPDPITALQLDVTGVLHWRPSTNCNDTSYLLYISYEDVLEHLYALEVTYVNVSHLPACELHTFLVVAMADSIVSEPLSIQTTMPAEPDANLTVTKLHATPQGDDGVYLEWELNEQYQHCVQYYRVVHFDGESVPVDAYTTFENMFIDGLPACSRLEITVVPIYNDDMEGGVGVVMYDTPAHNPTPPELESIRPGRTYFDMTLRLPSYFSNRCPISQVIVDGSPYTNLTIPITDSRARPPVPVHVEGLREDSMYFFRITMINSGGPSSPIAVGIQTRPSADIN